MHKALALLSLATAFSSAQALYANEDAPAEVSTNAESGSSEESAPERNYTAHLQSTAVPQRHEAMASPYQGGSSFTGQAEQNASFSGTVYLGFRPFKYTEFFVNPEVIGGGGLSSSSGLGAYPNGEINRASGTGLQATLARAYVSQLIPLGSELEAVTDDENQISGQKAAHYLKLTVGKYSIADLLDGNTYSHDQRGQFLNWCLMDNCAWDYSMNDFGYTYAAAAEFVAKDWAFRAVFATETVSPNSPEMEWDLGRAHSLNLEVERSYKVLNRPGKVRLLVYENSSQARTYTSALQEFNTPAPEGDEGLAAAIPPSAIDPVRFHTKFGAGLNVEQEISENLGVFARAGANDGRTESWSFTEADRTLAGGISLNGRLWRRSDDVFGLGAGVNGITQDHRAYLGSGGQGLMLGDSTLNYGPEQVVEAYYLFSVPMIKNLTITPDIQLVANPGFNQDRGPAAVYAMRLHYSFGI